ncbi:cation-transporting P-type ATPase [Patescibacteria group bacterium]|nr:cation-transporting P-type ATPase [Patescibacteria group bacterium]MBU1952954.1 cation-transporting P-type ATPase [Patescibacteria group bacterium]
MPQGLTFTEARQRLIEYGFNEIVEVSKSTPFKILLRQIKSNFVIYMLSIAVVISFSVGKPITAYTILIVIFIVIFVGFFQEYKAEESINSLKKMLMPISIAYRDGKKKEIPSRDIVPEDIILLGNGEKIPADCELLESFDLRVNESALTGESKEIAKIAKSNNEQQITDQNRIFMGTYIVNGRCLAKVTHTGMNTNFGKIAHLISTAEKELPLQNKVNTIAKYMVTIAIVASISTGALLAFRAPVINTAVLVDILILMIALSVSAFPEGFPIVLATTLALGAKRMSEKKAIVNRMSIIETLGEVTAICSDKTGTITRGEMTVKFIFTGNELYEVQGSGYVAHGKITKEGIEVDINKQQDIKQMLLASILCNNSEIERTGENNDYRAIGSPTETALLILGAKVGIFKDNFLYDRVNEYPFNSERKMMSVLFVQDGRYYVYAKGAPEVLLEKCSKAYNNGNEKVLTNKEKERIYSLQQEMSSTAYRTLVTCYKEIDAGNKSYEEENFTFLGLIAMEDPPREEVAEAIKTAKSAGIKVYMVTGDSKETALSIAKQIGLSVDTKTLDGNTMDQLSDAELAIEVKETTVFARVKPEHKIRLVKIFKALGEIVAMTGDGVNDAPALKEAHVGIAMGKNGTDVSRSVADLILRDDNFATIVSAIAEGRTVYNNIRKFVTYQLSCNLAELITLFLGVLLAPTLGWQTPLLVSIQILFMNLVTDNLPALTLGVNPTSKDIMEDKPRNNGDILNSELLKLLLGTAFFMAFTTLLAYFISFNVLGLTLEVSRTVALLTLILVEIASAFSFRSFRKMTLTRSPFVNKYLVTASILSICFTLVIIYTPFNKILETTPLNITGWIIALVCSSLILILNDVIKTMNLRNPNYISSTK